MTGVGLVLAALPIAGVSSTAVLLVTDEPTSVLTRRTAAELGASGYLVSLLEWGAESIPADAVGHLARQHGAGAAILLLAGHGRVEAWVPDEKEDGLVGHPLALDVPLPPAVAAFKVVEILRVFLLPRVQEDEPPPPAAEEPRAWLGVGAGALGSRGAPLPVLDAGGSFRVFDHGAVGLGVEVSLVPFRASLTEGAAALSVQRLVLEGLGLLLEPDHRWRLSIGLGAMVERLVVEGTAVAPWASATKTEWNAGGRLSLGASLRLARRLRLSIVLAATASPRQFSIIVADHQVGRWGWFTWTAALSAEVGVWP